MKRFPAAVASCIAAAAFAPSWHWFSSKQTSSEDILAQLDLARVGGQLLSSSLPLWQLPDFMAPEEVDAIVAQLPDENGFGECNRTEIEHKTLAGRSCARIQVGEELRGFLSRVGPLFRADLSSASHLFVVRYVPGAPGIPSHVDKYSDKSRNDVSILVYLRTGARPDSGLTTFPRVGVSVQPRNGTALVWMSSHTNSEHALSPIHSDEPLDRLVLQIALNLRGVDDGFELPQIAGSAPIGDFTPDCASWCNAWTCNVWGCLDCPRTVHVCASLHEGTYCASWCNSWTSSLSHCLGCSVNQTNSSSPQSASSLRGSNATEVTMNESKGER